ncbi:toll/interleukin-1 receptor domain-containing protein [Saccharopolyspora shandongensis]|uniref:toll/interleukin-1 receptor domain-containing protein n=1 Tax=Saccharopolyspora shandongensis TaxID=418495 RepID=UPI0033F2411D
MTHISVDAAGHDAFISYSHADKDVAAALYKGLTRLARPNFRRRAMRVFRDAESLSAGSLPKSIERGLLDSRYFILLASPNAARSEWVRREVGLWQEHRSPENFLIAVAGGEVNWGDGDFDWSRTDALPPGLSGWFDSEPLCVPLATARRRDALSLRHAEFRSAVCKLAAPVRDVAPDELDSEDIRLHRRRKYVARSLVALLCVLTLIAGVASILAVQQRNRAEDQARVALSRALAAESLAQPNARLAAQLAGVAYSSAPTTQARGALMAVLNRNRRVVSFVRPPEKEVHANRPAASPPQSHVSLSPDGSLLAFAAGEDAQISLWDTRQHRVIGELRQPQPGVQALQFTPDGRTLIAHDGGGFQIWDVATRRQVGDLVHESPFPRIAVSPDSSLLAATDGDAGVSTRPPQLWDLRTGEETLLAEAPVEVSAPLVFTPDGRRLLVGHAGSGPAGSTTSALLPVDVATGSWLPQEALPATGGEAAAGGGLLVVSDGEQVQLWDLANRAQVASMHHPGGVDSVAISADGSTVAIADRSFRVIALDRNLRNPVQLTEETTPVLGLALSANGDLAAVAATDNGVSLLSARSDARVISQPAPLGDLELEALAVGGRRAVVAGAGGAQVWDLASGTVERTLPTTTAPGDISSWEIRVALNSAGTRLALQVGGQAGIWDLDTGRELQRFSGTYDAQNSIYGSAGIRFLSGDYAVLVDRDGGPEIVDVRSGDVIGKVEVPGLEGGFATDREGRTVAVVEDDALGIIGVYRWDGQELSRVGEVGGGFRVRDLAISPDGGRIAFTDIDNRIFLRDLDGTLATEIQPPELSGAGLLTFSPDGGTLIDGDDAIRFWDVSTGALIGTWAVDGANHVHSTRPALTDDGDLVVAATGAPHRWAVRPDQWRTALCALGAGELQGPERAQHLGGIEVSPACTP